MSKTVCIYHSIDLDGWMSAAVVKYWFKLENNDFNTIPDNNSIDFLGWNYGDEIPNLSEYDKVIMCDVSFPKEEMYKLCEKRSENYPDFNFVYIDHHISAINDLQKVIEGSGTYTDYPNGVMDVKLAACELTWQYFFPDKKMPEIVRLLGRYDCFGHKGTNEEQEVLEFQYGARSYISSYEDAYKWLHQDIDLIEDAGASIYEYLCTEAKQAYKNGFDIELYEPIDLTNKPHLNYPKRKFICFNKERFNPINFGINYHKDGYEGAACFHYANGMWNFSLYNDNGKVDCSEIAKQYDGGGHKGAAGFRIKNINDILNNA
jgi:uncharacterized protein